MRDADDRRAVVNALSQLRRERLRQPVVAALDSKVLVARQTQRGFAQAVQGADRVDAVAEQSQKAQPEHVQILFGRAVLPPEFADRHRVVLLERRRRPAGGIRAGRLGERISEVLSRAGGPAHSPSLEVRDECASRALHLDEGQLEQPGVSNRQRVAAGDRHRAGLRVQPVGERLAKGEDASTGPLPGLEDRHVVSRGRQLVRRAQPGEPRSDHDDPLRSLCRAMPWSRDRGRHRRRAPCQELPPRQRQRHHPIT